MESPLTAPLFAWGSLEDLPSLTTVRVKQALNLRRFPPIPRATNQFERRYQGRTAAVHGMPQAAAQASYLYDDRNRALHALGSGEGAPNAPDPAFSLSVPDLLWKGRASLQVAVTPSRGLHYVALVCILQPVSQDGARISMTTCVRRFLSGLCGAVVLGAFCWSARATDPNPPSIHSNQGAWPIRRQWNMAEARHYAKWVENIYLMKTRGSVEQRIAKLERILTDPEMNLLLVPEFLGKGSNPQLPLGIIRQMHAMLDCGRFTAFVPAYYAYRRALPWMISHVRSGRGDPRTAPANIPTGCTSSFASPSVEAFFLNAVGPFGSGHYRVELNGRNAHLSDTVPVAITREFLLPGCINYVDGHCLLLARVSEYGELHFLNAGTALTRDIFTYNGMNTVGGITPRGNDPENEWKGCYQGLRVLRYPIAEVNRSGEVIRVRRRTDEEMREFGFSTEQYDRVREMYEKQYIAEGRFKPQSFHDFIRLRMKTADTIAPLKFMEEYVDELLEVYKVREQFVQDAWRDYLKNGPITYPEERSNENIFQAFGRWETWSSPSSDVDRRNKYFYLADWLEYAIRWYGVEYKSVDLTGLEKYHIRSQGDLAKALVAEKQRLFAEHTMQYTNSKGEKITLSLLDIERRLYDLSFDPNHPPELRWGAPLGSAERASAPQTYTPVPGRARVPMEDAYRWQTYYRTVGQRETEMSCLRGMFTEGFPVRKLFDMQLAKWFDVTEPPEALLAEEAEKAPPPYILVPHDRLAVSSTMRAVLSSSLPPGGGS